MAIIVAMCAGLAVAQNPGSPSIIANGWNLSVTTGYGQGYFNVDGVRKNLRDHRASLHSVKKRACVREVREWGGWPYLAGG